jgi:hypothetical protein
MAWDIGLMRPYPKISVHVAPEKCAPIECGWLGCGMRKYKIDVSSRNTHAYASTWPNLPIGFAFPPCARPKHHEPEQKDLILEYNEMTAM